MAAAERIPFWCDDHHLRSIAAGMGVATFSTVDLIRHLQTQAQISREIRRGRKESCFPTTSPPSDSTGQRSTSPRDTAVRFDTKITNKPHPSFRHPVRRVEVPRWEPPHVVVEAVPRWGPGRVKHTVPMGVAPPR